MSHPCTMMQSGVMRGGEFVCAHADVMHRATAADRVARRILGVVLMRVAGLVVVLVWIGVLGPAQAQSSAAICGGKYAAAGEMLDAAFGRFGTLYAGSEDVGIGRDVGATLDLYRLWHGLPDYGFRNGADLYKPVWMQHQPPGGPWEYPANQPEWADFALNHALPYALAPNETYLSAGPRDWVASTLDVLTVPGQARIGGSTPTAPKI